MRGEKEMYNIIQYFSKFSLLMFLTLQLDFFFENVIPHYQHMYMLSVIIFQYWRDGRGFQHDEREGSRVQEACSVWVPEGGFRDSSFWENCGKRQVGGDACR